MPKVRIVDIGLDGVPTNVDADCSDDVFLESAKALPGAVFQVPEVNGQPVPVKGAIYPLQYCIEG